MKLNKSELNRIHNTKKIKNNYKKIKCVDSY